LAPSQPVIADHRIEPEAQPGRTTGDQTLDDEASFRQSWTNLPASSNITAMNKRPTPRSKPKKGKDPYMVVLGETWPTIRSAYEDFKDLKPIIEYRPQEKIVYAYPASPYIDDLTERTREQARQTYQDAVAAGNFMVFVCDTRDRVLRSYVFPLEEPGDGRIERAGS